MAIVLNQIVQAIAIVSSTILGVTKLSCFHQMMTGIPDGFKSYYPYRALDSVKKLM